MGPIQKTIQDKLQQALDPDHLEVVNESGQHNVPAGSESHFKVTVVAMAFENSELIERHRNVNGILAAELAGDVHALSLQTLTPDEWVARGKTPHTTPACRGGGKSGGDTPGGMIKE